MERRYFVRPIRIGWTVEHNGQMLCSCAHFDDAVALAERTAQRTGGELVIRTRSGEVRRERFTVAAREEASQPINGSGRRRYPRRRRQPE